MEPFCSGVMADLRCFSAAFSGLWGAINPLAVAVLFLGMGSRYSAGQRRAMVGTACKVALGLMVFFALLGRQILDVLGTGIPSLCVGCGILTAATGFSMLCSSDGPADESAGSVGFGSQRPNLAITPLAVPLIAGPYPIAEIVERAALLRSLCDWIALLASIFLAVGCVALLLNIAGKLVDSLGKTLPKLFFRISGLVLLSMAVQFILVGLEQIEPFARLLSGRC